MITDGTDITHMPQLFSGTAKIRSSTLLKVIFRGICKIPFSLIGFNILTLNKVYSLPLYHSFHPFSQYYSRILLIIILNVAEDDMYCFKKLGQYAMIILDSFNYIASSIIHQPLVRRNPTDSWTGTIIHVIICRSLIILKFACLLALKEMNHGNGFML